MSSFPLCPSQDPFMPVGWEHHDLSSAWIFGLKAMGDTPLLRHNVGLSLSGEATELS